MTYTRATTPLMDTLPPNEVERSIFVTIVYRSIALLLSIGLIFHILAILATRKANKVKPEDKRHSLPSFLLTCLLRIDMVAVIFLFVRGFLSIKRSIIELPVWCDFSVSTSIFFTWSSGLANCLMCAEKSTSLIAPFFHRRYATLRKATVSLAILQLSAFVICLLPLFGFGTYKIVDESTNQCDCVTPGEPRATMVNKYHLYFSIIFFVVGFSIITWILVCNVIIVYFIFHIKNKAAHLNASGVPASLHDTTRRSSHSTIRKSNSRETRFAWIMILVSIAYMISWLPLYLERTLVAFNVEPSEESKSVGIWIHVFNYIITPVIFVFFKKRNRAGLRLVCVDYCCCCCHGYRRRVKAKINISQFGSVVTENTLNRQQP